MDDNESTQESGAGKIHTLTLQYFIWKFDTDEQPTRYGYMFEVRGLSIRCGYNICKKMINVILCPLVGYTFALIDIVLNYYAHQPIPFIAEVLLSHLIPGLEA